MHTERANLLACIGYATTQVQPARLIALTAALAAFLLQEGPWHQAAALHDTAATTAHHHGDRRGEAWLRDLGRVRSLTGNYPAATSLLERALALCQDLGDRRGEADALRHLGRVRYLTGDYPAATSLLERALALCQDLGDRRGEADALRHLGRVRYLTGNYPAATSLLERALALFRELGDLQGEAEALNSTGTLLAKSAGPQEALALYRKALHLARQVHSPLDEARALEGAARCMARTGDKAAALTDLGEAVAIYQRIGAVEVGTASAYLATLEVEARDDFVAQHLTIYRRLNRMVQRVSKRQARGGRRGRTRLGPAGPGLDHRRGVFPTRGPNAVGGWPGRGSARIGSTSPRWGTLDPRAARPLPARYHLGLSVQSRTILSRYSPSAMPSAQAATLADRTVRPALEARQLGSQVVPDPRIAQPRAHPQREHEVHPDPRGRSRSRRCTVLVCSRRHRPARTASTELIHPDGQERTHPRPR